MQKFQRFVLKPAIIALFAADGIGYFIARSNMNDAPPVPQGWVDRGLAATAPAYVPMPDPTMPQQAVRLGVAGIEPVRSEAAEQFPAGAGYSEAEPELAGGDPAEVSEPKVAAARPVAVKRVNSTARLGATTPRPANAAFARAFPAQFKPIVAAAGGNRQGLAEPDYPDYSAALSGEGPAKTTVPPENGQGSESPPSGEPLTDELPALSEPTRAVTGQQADAPVLPASSADADAELPGVADAVTGQAEPVGPHWPATAAAISDSTAATTAGGPLIQDQRDLALQFAAGQRGSAQHAAGLAAANISAAGSVPRKHQAAAVIAENRGEDFAGSRGSSSMGMPPSPANLAERGPGRGSTGDSAGFSVSAVQDPSLRGVGESDQTVDALPAAGGPSIRLRDLLAAVAAMMDANEFRELSGSTSADALVTVKSLQDWGIPVAYNPGERTISTPAGATIKIAG